MDCSKTENYIAERARMTKNCVGMTKNREEYCVGCPFDKLCNEVYRSYHALEALYTGEAIKIVQQWSDAHPRKTWLNKLEEALPNMTHEFKAGCVNFYTPSDVFSEKADKQNWSDYYEDDDNE